jgi:hypothetical protein
VHCVTKIFNLCEVVNKALIYSGRFLKAIAEPIVLVILKSACFLIHALIPRDLKARGLKSAGYEKREVVPHAVKSARYPALLRKARTFGKIVQN